MKNQQNDLLCAKRRLRSAWASAQSDQSLLSAWRKLGSLATHWVYSKYSDQTGLWVFRIRIDYWWNAETTIIHQDLWLGKFVPSSHHRSEFSNTILCNFSRWDQRIREDIQIPDSLGEEATFINIYICNGGLKCIWLLISTKPTFGNKVICWYTDFTFETFI